MELPDDNKQTLYLEITSSSDSGWARNFIAGITAIQEGRSLRRFAIAFPGAESLTAFQKQVELLLMKNNEEIAFSGAIFDELFITTKPRTDDSERSYYQISIIVDGCRERRNVTCVVLISAYRVRTAPQRGFLTDSLTTAIETASANFARTLTASRSLHRARD
jgi:hypothetical protein